MRDDTAFNKTLTFMETSVLPHHQALLRNAYLFATTSDDDNTKLAAVLYDGNDWTIPLTQGANVCVANTCDGAERQRRLQFENKRFFIEHAERNAILKCAKLGIRTQGSIMVCPWFACNDCAKAIVQAGIVEVIGHRQYYDFWRDKTPSLAKVLEIDQSILRGVQIMRENGVKMILYSGKIDIKIDLKLKVAGSDFQP